ncbi:carbohydrate ABC transporter permease [Streptomyces geranii]|uniref:carbohydrate ABC transporter permease n=1 Tax=Streptomyces geranii TaxID=2058923 RepID=UPI000D02D51C|nr:carbohydrate ABC transporter permease [Streptomyces geranii]
MTTPTTLTSPAPAPAPTPTRAVVLPPRPRPTLGRIAAWAVLAAIMLVTLLPFYWILRTALSTNTGLAANPADPLPVGLTTGGFERALGLQSTKEAIAQGGAGGSLDFWRYLLNSVIVSTLITGCQIFFSAMAAYAFARLRWRGRDTVFGLFLAGLMVPAIFTLLPNFVLIKQLGLIDSLLGISLPTMFMTPFAVFFLRQFFMNVPREVEEAALLDGAGKIRIFFRVMLPMASTPVVTLGVLTYITSWNDYFWPLMVSYTDNSRLLTVALAMFRAQTPQTGYDWSGLMAATLIAALPMLVLFGFFARRIVSSISFTGVK